MTTESAARDRMALHGRSLYARGLCPGTSGNLSVKLDDGLLVTPTNCCLGRLDPAHLGDERAREALDLVASRADAKGRWKLQQTFNDRFVVPIETKGQPSRWVTLRALEVLRAASLR